MYRQTGIFLQIFTYPLVLFFSFCILIKRSGDATPKYFYLTEMKNEPHINKDDLEGAYRTARLIAGYIRSTLTEEEKDELDDWICASDDNMRLFARLTDEKNVEDSLKQRHIFDSEAAIEKLEQKIKAEQTRKTVRKSRVFLYATAATVLLMAALFMVFRYTNTPSLPRHIISEKPDLKPGGDKATLTIADGRTIALDSTQKNIVEAGNVQVTNAGGQLLYEGNSSKEEWHTLTTPKGGQYRLVLPDGSMVWLNAASSITYPTAFTGSQRTVEITGEAYFEVMHYENRRFIVSANRITTEVLGTHFNVNAYDDEAGMKITLLEGSVKISQNNGRSAILKPGQQAQLETDGKLLVTDNINTEEVLAWKNGWFDFNDASIETIMRQVARWYGVDIRYEGKVNYHFNAEIERNVPVSKLFQLLEMTDRVHFTIKDTTIIVNP